MLSLRCLASLPSTVIPQQPFPLAMQVPKRRVNDCYHNYMWMGLATGSIGAPAPWRPPGGMLPDRGLGYYDLSGVIYPPSFWGEPFNWYTEEILDSMLSLKRFTSLVKWRAIQEAYRPVRVSSQSTGTSITLRNGQYGSSLSQNEWLWTAASDKTITVGWILRNFPYNYEIPEKDDIWTTSTVTPPWLEISGLTSGIDLELVWFDDHKGKIIGNRPTTTSGHFLVQAPDTDTTPQLGFGKSVAFLIQPVGWTPTTTFEALPNGGDRIGQIVVSPRKEWHDEHPSATTQTLTFTAVTKPRITDPSRYKFEWYFGELNPQFVVRDGVDYVDHVPSYYGWNKVRLEIKDKWQGDKRVSGDIIYVRIDSSQP